MSERFYTKYIRTLYTKGDSGSATSAELRVEDSEQHPGRLDIGVFGWKSGTEYGVAHVRGDRVEALRDALTEWLDKTAPTTEPEPELLADDGEAR